MSIFLIFFIVIGEKKKSDQTHNFTFIVTAKDYLQKCTDHERIVIFSIVYIVIVLYNGSARSTRFEFWAVALAVEAAAALLRNAVSRCIDSHIVSAFLSLI